MKNRTTMDWNRHLAKLPEHEPKADLWQHIEADLAFEAKMDKTLSQLPECEPDNLLWQRIERRLPQTAPWWQRSGTWAAAASVTVGLVLAWMLWPTPPETVTIEYRQEMSVAPPQVADVEIPTAADQEAEAFIARQCAEQVVLCQKPEVKELRQQLAELTAENEKLAAQMSVFGQDEALVKAQIKIENQRTAVTKELIELLQI